MLDEADRLRQQFFRLQEQQSTQEPSQHSGGVWEPPVDIVAYGSEVEITVALPGVAPERVQVRIDEHGDVVIAARRPMPINERTSAVHRLEIPYGGFERRIALPAGRYRLIEQACANGCLVLRLALQ